MTFLDTDINEHLYNYTVDYLSEDSESYISEDVSKFAPSTSKVLPKSTPPKIIEFWSDGDTRYLLDKYHQYLNDIGPMKKFKNKKEMWVKISQEIGGKNGKQCEQRFKTVMRRKKLAVANNSTSGNKRKNIEYEEEMRKIAAIDDSVEPEIQLSSNNMVRKESSERPGKENRVKISSNKKAKTVQETLLQIYEKKEQNRERRHREKMEKADNLEKLLYKVLEQKNTPENEKT